MPTKKRGAKPRRNLTRDQKLSSPCYDACSYCGEPKAKVSPRCNSCKIQFGKTPVLHSTFMVEGKPCRYIGLTKGQVTVVSERRYAELSVYEWCALQRPQGGFYAVRHVRENRKRITVYMHRQIIGGSSAHIDHRNGDGLDNRDDNLRPCTRGQNQANSRVRRKTTSGYKGVYPAANAKFNPHNRQWVALIELGGQTKYLGSFHTAEEGARTYDRAAIRYFGEFAHTNFSRTDY